jgi:hypothetical protein
MLLAHRAYQVAEKSAFCTELSMHGGRNIKASEGVGAEGAQFRQIHSLAAISLGMRTTKCWEGPPEAAERAP